MTDIICTNLNNPDCTSRKILDLLGNKWSAHILYELASGPIRYNELKRHVEGISFKMLTQTLRDLERNHLINRESKPIVPPHVEYSLTPLGADLLRQLVKLVEWGFDHASDLGWKSDEDWKSDELS